MITITYLLFKDESEYVCTQPITLKFCMGSSFHQAWQQARGQPQMLTPGGTPYSDPVCKTLKGKELGRGQQTKVAPRGEFIYLCGAHPNLGPSVPFTKN